MSKQRKLLPKDIVVQTGNGLWESLGELLGHLARASFTTAELETTDAIVWKERRGGNQQRSPCRETVGNVQRLRHTIYGVSYDDEACRVFLRGDEVKIRSAQPRVYPRCWMNGWRDSLVMHESVCRTMAKEMMEFTKNNILTQAAQAMLAQANQQPQGVLQLLR